MTNKITRYIPKIFDYLFYTYENVSSQEMRMLTTPVESMIFPPNELVDALYTEINELSTIAELAKALMSDQQKIDRGYLSLQKIQVYNIQH